MHFNEPGRTDWEGSATGSRGLAREGGRCSSTIRSTLLRCTITPADFDRKRAALESASIVDSGYGTGSLPGPVQDMAEMAARGVVGFKAFMCAPGLPEFPRADDATLLDGLREARGSACRSRFMRRRGAEGIPARARRPRTSSIPGPSSPRSKRFSGRCSLPERQARSSTSSTSAPGAAVVMAAEARARAWTCRSKPVRTNHYFTEEDVERLGVVAKMRPAGAPGKRTGGRCDRAGWTAASPSSRRHSRRACVETGDSCRRGEESRGAIDACRILGRALTPPRADGDSRCRPLTLERIVELVSTQPARRFDLAAKGRLGPGADADVMLVDLQESIRCPRPRLHQRTRRPYVGASFRDGCGGRSAAARPSSPTAG